MNAQTAEHVASVPPPIASETQPTASGTQPAGFWLRLVANIVDGIILGFLAAPIGILIGFFQVAGAGVSEEMGLITGLVGILVNFVTQMVVAFLYFGYFYTTRGATPGKALFLLKVVNYENGMNLTWGQTAMREVLGKFCSSAILMIGYLMAAFRQDKRALHDLMGNTQVLQVKK